MKRIAFIDSAGIEKKTYDGVEKRRFEENMTIVNKLREKHDVKCFYRLHSGTLKEMMEDARVNGSYQGIITHVPAQGMPSYMVESGAARRVPWSQMTAFMYKSSLMRIEAIHNEFPGAKIIAYTGAGNISVPDYSLEDIGVSL